MKNSECIIEQYLGGKLVRAFIPTGDQTLPWRMCVNGKSYPRTHGWVLSKILPTLIEHSLVTTKVVPMEVSADAGGSGLRTEPLAVETGPDLPTTSSCRSESRGTVKLAAMPAGLDSLHELELVTAHEVLVAYCTDGPIIEERGG
ncbi:hypothetical protein [Paucibacter sp. XJ19-41]|uniref:hypothetical protein n=1 Tax=Paucibacter sp. XJ19-41 TaxID=2927824 RepID=UPI002349D3DF|nr:hypothetical protein [Paucibacter sp. XJ19-41]MDC6168727.1 hypothetical protein [Paucibacter sp. XJ19-41]